MATEIRELEKALRSQHALAECPDNASGHCETCALLDGHHGISTLDEIVQSICQLDSETYPDVPPQNSQAFSYGYHAGIQHALRQVRKLFRGAEPVTAAVTAAENTENQIALQAGSAETGGEKAAQTAREFYEKNYANCFDGVCISPEELFYFADTYAANFRCSSQNQTVSTGVEGAHEGTTADKSVALAESSLSSTPPESLDEPWRKAGVLYDFPPKRCAECDHDIFISAGPTKYECYICSLEREIEWLRKRM